MPAVSYESTCEVYPLPPDSAGKLGLTVKFVLRDRLGRILDQIEADFRFAKYDSQSVTATGTLTGKEYVVVAQANAAGIFDYDDNTISYALKQQDVILISSRTVLEFKW